MDDDLKSLLQRLSERLDALEKPKVEKVEVKPEPFSMDALAALIREQNEAASKANLEKLQETQFDLYVKQRHPDFVSYLSEAEDDFGTKTLERIKSLPFEDRLSALDKVEAKFKQAQAQSTTPITPRQRAIKQQRDSQEEAYRDNSQKLKKGEIPVEDFKNNFWDNFEKELAVVAT